MTNATGEKKEYKKYYLLYPSNSIALYILYFIVSFQQLDEIRRSMQYYIQKTVLLDFQVCLHDLGSSHHPHMWNMVFTELKN